jgi:DNA topoisomerase IA
VGRVKTPTLAIVCKRELKIRNFVPQADFEVVATAQAAGGRFRMRRAPKERIIKRVDAEAIAAAAEVGMRVRSQQPMGRCSRTAFRARSSVAACSPL